MKGRIGCGRGRAGRAAAVATTAWRFGALALASAVVVPVAGAVAPREPAASAISTRAANPSSPVKTAASASGTQREASPSRRCRPSKRRPKRPRGGAVAAPVCGAYFGAWTSPNTGWTNNQRERQIGRRYRIVHRYHDWREVFPEAREVAWARRGRILFLAWASRIYRTGKVIPWSAIASGAEDAQIDRTAARVKALRRPVLMDFMHEPESWLTGVGQLGSMGTAAEFAAAYRHIVKRFRRDRVTNVSWVWTVMGDSGHYSLYTGGRLYPGDDVVDWIAWDPYNWYTCHNSSWKSFADKVSPFYRWLLQHGHGNKPFMLAEYGSNENPLDPWAKGRWFDDELTTMRARRFPNLKAVVYFDSTSDCNWRLDSSSYSLERYAAIANDPLFAAAPMRR